MARKKQQPEDPWSGFVDVLSNVVMVVTFLVIILGIAMFALSQQVAKTMAAEMLKSEKSRQQIERQINRESEQEAEEAASAASAAALAALRDRLEKEVAAAEEALKKAEAKVDAMASELASLRDNAKQNGSEGKNSVTVDRPLLQADEIDGSTNLTVRSRKVPEDFETIVATAEQVADEDGTTRVETSDLMLKVAYEPSLYKIDAATTEKIRAFLEEKSDVSSGSIELRAFANSSIGSVSEARRIAYYRAMTVRSVAVAAGYDPAQIKIALRESEQETDANSIMIFAKSK